MSAGSARHILYNISYLLCVVYIEEGFWFLPIHNSNRRVFALTPIICHYFHIVFVLHFQCGLPVYIYIQYIQYGASLKPKSLYYNCPGLVPRVFSLSTVQHCYFFDKSSTVCTAFFTELCFEKYNLEKETNFRVTCHLRKYIINYMYAQHLYTIRSLNNL